MAKQTINIGSAELAGDGESLRSAFDKINDNFNELYAADVSIDAQFLEGNPGAFYLDYTNFVNTPQIPLDVSDLTDTTNLLSAGGIELADLSVTTNSASSNGALTYNNVSGVFEYTPPDLSGYQTIAGLATVATTGQYTDLLNTPTIPSVLTDLSISDGTAGQVLTTDGNGAFSFTTGGIALTDLSVGAEDPASGDGGISYNNTTGVFTYAPPDLSLYQPVGNLNADIDSHLNTSTATANQILSWDGADYAWVADQTSGGGTDTVIAPFAFANVETTADGSGTGISWSNWNSGNGSLDFTFDIAQANTQYTVVTDSETFDDYSVGINSKSTTGFTAEFYDNSGTRVPSNFSPFTIIVYAETPTATITGTSLSNASIGALSDVSISSATTGQVLKYNGSSWVNDAGGSAFTNIGVGADDSTIRNISEGESFLILGGTGITTASNAEGDITITGFDGAFGSLTGTPTTLSGYGITDAYTKAEVDSAVADSFSFSVAADDSTLREISNDESIKFVGAQNVTTSSDAEGQITITGPDLSGYAQLGSSTTFTADVSFDTGVQEAFGTVTGATGVTTLDCNNGHLFYLTGATGDITANFTNLGLTAEYATNLTVIIDQGGTEYEITAVQIGGVAQTIVWQGNSAPTGTANGVDSFSFTILNDGGTYVVLGQMVSFGGV